MRAITLAGRARFLHELFDSCLETLNIPLERFFLTSEQWVWANLFLAEALA